MRLLILFTAAGMALPLLTAQQTPNVAGTWKFTVQLDGGGTGEPTFVLRTSKEEQVMGKVDDMSDIFSYGWRISH